VRIHWFAHVFARKSKKLQSRLHESVTWATSWLAQALIVTQANPPFGDADNGSEAASADIRQQGRMR
jgi:hypothetical protein